MERKEILLMVLIGFLVLTTAVQAVQLVTLSSNPVAVSGSSTAPKAAGSSGAVVAPSSLDNLPSMVGGC